MCFILRRQSIRCWPTACLGWQVSTPQPRSTITSSAATACFCACSSAAGARRGGLALLRELDGELVESLAERQTGLRGVEPHDHAVAVLEPDFPVRPGGDGETSRALDPGHGELGE